MKKIALLISVQLLLVISGCAHDFSDAGKGCSSDSDISANLLEIEYEESESNGKPLKNVWVKAAKEFNEHGLMEISFIKKNPPALIIPIREFKFKENKTDQLGYVMFFSDTALLNGEYCIRASYYGIKDNKGDVIEIFEELKVQERP